MKNLVVIGGLLLASAGCESEPDSEVEFAAVESTARGFFELVAAYDYAGLRATCSPDFEIIEAGMRRDMDGFLSTLKPYEAAGLDLRFEVTDFNTEVSGNVAYTTNRTVSEGSAYFEALVLRRTDSGWLVDRVFSTPAADTDP